jgi:hypothetical protein
MDVGAAQGDRVEGEHGEGDPGDDLPPSSATRIVRVSPGFDLQ